MRNNKNAMLAAMMFGNSGGGGSGLPAIESGDAGKVLTVNNSETGAEWNYVPSELPAVSAADAGKVLKVNSGGTGLEWGAAAGGDTLYEHSLRIYWQGNSGAVFYMYSVIVNKTNTAFNYTSLKNWIKAGNRLRGSGAIATAGKNTAINGHMIEVGYNSSEDAFTLSYFSTSSFSELSMTATGVSVSDTVISI